MYHQLLNFFLPLKGAYGLVDLVIDQYSQKEYVLKRCSVQRPENFEIVNKEIKILQMFTGPFVVDYIASEIVYTPKGREALILLGYCPGGNLFEKLTAQNGQFIPFKTTLTIFYQILKSVERFHHHSPPVTHRDLKLENLLFAVVSIAAALL
jgi:AP2-associated kinase